MSPIKRKKNISESIKSVEHLLEIKTSRKNQWVEASLQNSFLKSIFKVREIEDKRAYKTQNIYKNE
jgi:hypothetical protein